MILEFAAMLSGHLTNLPEEEGVRSYGAFVDTVSFGSGQSARSLALSAVGHPQSKMY